MNQVIWVLEYTHRHGVDFTAFESEADAYHGMAVIAAREAPDECTHEIALQIQAFFNMGHDVEAIEIYLAHVPGESLHIHAMDVAQRRIIGLVLSESDSDIVHAARCFPRGDVSPGQAWCGRAYTWAATETVWTEAFSFRAWIPREPRIVTCIGCVASEYYGE